MFIEWIRRKISLWWGSANLSIHPPYLYFNTFSYVSFACIADILVVIAIYAKYLIVWRLSCCVTGLPGEFANELLERRSSRQQLARSLCLWTWRSWKNRALVSADQQQPAERAAHSRHTTQQTAANPNSSSPVCTLCYRLIQLLSTHSFNNLPFWLWSSILSWPLDS